MIIQDGSCYSLPDGTHVIARTSDYQGAMRFEDLTGTPLYHWQPYSMSIYRIIVDRANGALYSAYCDLTLDDLTPEMGDNSTEFFEEDEDHTLCPDCNVTMRRTLLARSTIYRCPDCGSEFKV